MPRPRARNNMMNGGGAKMMKATPKVPMSGPKMPAGGAEPPLGARMPKDGGGTLQPKSQNMKPMFGKTPTPSVPKIPSPAKPAKPPNAGGYF